MDLRLSAADRDLQQKARDFTDQILVPLEDECEEHDGLTPESHATAKQAVLDWEFHAINHAPENGGRGHDLTGGNYLAEAVSAAGIAALRFGYGRPDDFAAALPEVAGAA